LDDISFGRQPKGFLVVLNQITCQKEAATNSQWRSSQCSLPEWPQTKSFFPNHTKNFFLDNSSFGRQPKGFLVVSNQMTPLFDPALACWILIHNVVHAMVVV